MNINAWFDRRCVTPSSLRCLVTCNVTTDTRIYVTIYNGRFVGCMEFTFEDDHKARLPTETLVAERTQTVIPSHRVRRATSAAPTGSRSHGCGRSRQPQEHSSKLTVTGVISFFKDDGI